MTPAFGFRNRQLASALLSALVIVASKDAWGAETSGRTSSLSWVRLQGAESCIATQELALAVEDRLGRKVFVSASDADVSVEGHVARAGTPARWQAVLTIRDMHGQVLGTRELESAEADCSALDEPLVFVVSVMIDPDAAERAGSDAKPEPVTEPEKKPRPAPPPRVIVRRERVLVPARPEPEPWRVEADLAGTVSLGLMPGIAYGATASAVIEPPGFWGILLSGTYWLDETVPAERDAESIVSLAHAGAGLCPIGFSSGRLSQRTCAGVELGSLRSRGTGFDTEVANERLVAHVFVPNRVHVRLAGPLAAAAAITLVVPLVRTELTYRATDGSQHSIHQPSPVAVSAAVGLALAFP